MSRAFSSFHDFFCYFASAIINKPVMLPLDSFKGSLDAFGKAFCDQRFANTRDIFQ
jgi:hypothetical protein